MINPFILLIGIMILAFLVGLLTYLIIEGLHPQYKIIGNCKLTRWGCCDDGSTPKYDQKGTNCILGSVES